MAKPNEPENNDNNSINVTWGTLEELLLACAVNRYGNDCWDSVAREIQKRSSTFHFISPLVCQQKYHDLRRRFIAGPHYLTGTGKDNVEIAGVDTAAWLDELRRLRIDELKRELEHYDISIVSLQSKVNKLKEERQQSLTEDVRQKQQDGKSDLRKSQDIEPYNEDDHKSPVIEQRKLPPAQNSEKSSGEYSDRESISIKESNSTDPKAEEDLEKRVEQGRRLRKEAVEPAIDARQDPLNETENPVGEDSFNGSTDTTAIATEAKVRVDSDKDEKTRVRVDPAELLESVAESKGEGVGWLEQEGAKKEISDVQSSVNLCRKKEKGGVRAGVASVGEEPENGNQSKYKTIKEYADGKSEPLVVFLELIRSRKLDSVFEQRQQIQESCSYKNLIRRHMDLGNIQAALEQGHYSYCTTKFYRDLLLLATNFIVFFGKKSSEYQVANTLRLLIIKEIHQNASEQAPIPTTATGASSLVKPKAKEESREAAASTVADCLLMKPKLSGPVIACRKRSSITAKSMTSSAGGERRKDQGMSVCNDEKEKPDAETEREKSSSFGTVTTKRPRDQRSDTRSNSNKNKSKNYDNQQRPSPSRGASYEASRSDKKSNKNTGSAVSGKKGSAATFLNRIKRSSPSNSRSLLETLKNPDGKAETGKGATDHKKIAKSGERGRDDQNSRTNKKGKQLQQQVKDEERQDDTVEPRKDTRRPPKRVAAMASMGKRRRNSAAEMEAAPKKRARK